jgi:hypothetical protein
MSVSNLMKKIQFTENRLKIYEYIRTGQNIVLCH